MIETPKRRVTYLGVERDMPAMLADTLVRRGLARYAEETAMAAPAELAATKAPERAVRAIPAAKPARKPRPWGSKKGS